MTPRLALAAAVAAGLAALPPAALGDAQLYRKVVPSTVLFDLPDGDASGVLVDAKEKLVVTAAHVVQDEVRKGEFELKKIIFPSTGKDGRVITDTVFYRKRPEFVFPGRVVYLNRSKDLALVRLKGLPPRIAAVPLATVSPDPGETIAAIGNSNIYEGGTFGYSEGKVRNVHFHDKGGRVFYSVTHHAPTNKGDSGGAVLNTDGQLLAIVSEGTIGEGKRQVVDNSVHFREIARALEFVQQPGGRRFVATGMVDAPGMDEFYLPVTKGAAVGLTLKGNGTTDLDLYADDLDGPGEGKKGTRALVNETGDTDEEEGSFQAAWSGFVRVKVGNVGAKGKGKGKAVNAFTLTVSPFGLRDPGGDRVSAPITIIRRVAAKGDDAYEFAYQADAGKARVSVRGDGDSELTVTVEDPTGKVVGSGKCRENLVDVVWTPAATGTYKVKVHNPGTIWNRYVLTTD